MKKKKKMKVIIPCAVAAVVVIAGGIAVHTSLHDFRDTNSRYRKAVNNITYLENSIDEALPQTEIYNIIDSHFKSELPEGKKVKKAIVIGYDGCRLDALEGIDQNPDGALHTFIADGAKLYTSYCGGVPYPKMNTQKTSTAPGWCSMLTGVWADEHGIKDNGQVKSLDHLTLLTTLVENKTIKNSAFYVSWGGHFEWGDSTYLDEKKYTEEKNLAVTMLCAGDDNGTKENVIADLKNDECSDFIFSILEHCDHTGHGEGFFAGADVYKQAFKDGDNAAKEILDAIKSRKTYDEEDWLIIFTSDHGGTGKVHGFFTIQERYTFIAVNKDLDF